MAAPTAECRRFVYVRDGRQCVICGALELTFQHRRAVGMGGSRDLPPPVDGLALCIICNQRVEADLQGEALLNGWKVPRSVKDPSRVPVYYPREFAWYRLEGIRRVKITSAIAMEMGCAVYGEQWMHGRIKHLFERVWEQ